MTNLPTVELGSTGMQITRVGFGTWALGGAGWEASWGPQDDYDSIAAIERALDRGVNWIDTAAVYGFGHSEEVVAKALEGVPERPFVFTKASILEGADRTQVFSQKRDSLRHELELSLSRLKVDSIDLYQMHAPFPEEDLEEGWTTFAEFQAEGLVKHIGVSNYSVEQMELVSKIAPIETMQPQYSLICREAERDVLPFCQQHGIGVIVYSPMGFGLLTGKLTRERIAQLPEGDWRRGDENFQEPKLTEHLRIADRAVTIGERLGVPAGAAAIAWTLNNPAVNAAITGFRRPEQVEELIGAAELVLAEDDATTLSKG
jgi:aryl-alcohol dehydrogenase-like predicted oxidoreductase